MDIEDRLESHPLQLAIGDNDDDDSYNEVLSRSGRVGILIMDNQPWLIARTAVHDALHAFRGYLNRPRLDAKESLDAFWK